jgi:hypothetical protein
VRTSALRIITAEKNPGLESPQKDVTEILLEPVSKIMEKIPSDESLISLGWASF